MFIIRRETKRKVPAWFHVGSKFGWVLFALFSLGALVMQNWLVAIHMAFWAGVLAWVWQTTEPK